MTGRSTTQPVSKTNPLVNAARIFTRLCVLGGGAPAAAPMSKGIGKYFKYTKKQDAV
jgi:hypothetical protein